MVVYQNYFFPVRRSGVKSQAQNPTCKTIDFFSQNTKLYGEKINKALPEKKLKRYYYGTHDINDWA